MDPTTAEAMVTRALTSHGISREVIAAEFGVSGPLIGAIRNGKRYAKACPDLPRWRSCEHCIHWDQMRCTMGFPEPELTDFWRAAGDCSAYMRAA